jgi:hypothetical protein
MQSVPLDFDGVGASVGRFATNVIIGFGDVALEGACRGYYYYFFCFSLLALSNV